jgi:hypothetical protein
MSPTRSRPPFQTAGPEDSENPQVFRSSFRSTPNRFRSR